MTKPAQTVERDVVDAMVRKFYTKILADKIVGRFFVRALGSDMNKGKWPEHLSTLKDFWMLMMRDIPGYGGHPAPAHAFIGQLSIEAFERWLELFHETVHEFFTPEIAEQFYKKSQIVAQELIEFLGIDEEDEDD